MKNKNTKHLALSVTYKLSIQSLYVNGL